MKLPCEHILRTLTERKKEEEILAYVDIRWRIGVKYEQKDEVWEELNKIIEQEKPKANSKLNLSEIEGNSSSVYF